MNHKLNMNLIKYVKDITLLSCFMLASLYGTVEQTLYVSVYHIIYAANTQSNTQSRHSQYPLLKVKVEYFNSLFYLADLGNKV